MSEHHLAVARSILAFGGSSNLSCPRSAGLETPNGELNARRKPQVVAPFVGTVAPRNADRQIAAPCNQEPPR